MQHLPTHQSRLVVKWSEFYAQYFLLDYYSAIDKQSSFSQLNPIQGGGKKPAGIFFVKFWQE